VSPPDRGDRNFSAGGRRLRDHEFLIRTTGCANIVSKWPNRLTARPSSPDQREAPPLDELQRERHRLQVGRATGVRIGDRPVLDAPLFFCDRTSRREHVMAANPAPNRSGRQ